MSDTPYVCQFQLRYCKVPIVTGAVGYGGRFTKEQLRSDDALLKQVLSNLHNIITDSVSLPDALSFDDVEVIMYLPDLIN